MRLTICEHSYNCKMLAIIFPQTESRALEREHAQRTLTNGSQLRCRSQNYTWFAPSACVRPGGAAVADFYMSECHCCWESYAGFAVMVGLILSCVVGWVGVNERNSSVEIQNDKKGKQSATWQMRLSHFRWACRLLFCLDMHFWPSRFFVWPCHRIYLFSWFFFISHSFHRFQGVWWVQLLTMQDLGGLVLRYATVCCMRVTRVMRGGVQGCW